jgi:hypothetical protein
MSNVFRFLTLRSTMILYKPFIHVLKKEKNEGKIQGGKRDFA